MPGSSQNSQDLALLVKTTVDAGKIAMRWFKNDPEVWMKEGESPVSEADFAVDKYLRETLLAARPDYGWLSEETDDDGGRLASKRTFVVDPIDGTRGFIQGLKQWCISVAVVEDHRPVAAVLECPALDQTIAASLGQGTQLNEKTVQSHAVDAKEVLRITGPRSFQSAVTKSTDQPIEKVPFIPSLAYRIALVALGEVDVALARGSAKDWDLAAADLIAMEAGSKLTDMDGRLLEYNRNSVHHAALVASEGSRHEEMLDLARRAMNNRIS